MELYRDIPVIMVSGTEDLGSLSAAFDAGALDYLTKPPNRVELLARVRSALRLKSETDRRKARELDLVALTRQLEEHQPGTAASLFAGRTDRHRQPPFLRRVPAAGVAARNP